MRQRIWHHQAVYLAPPEDSGARAEFRCQAARTLDVARRDEVQPQGSRIDLATPGLLTRMLNGCDDNEPASAVFYHLRFAFGVLDLPQEQSSN
jgi:hypothetical protein